MKNGIRTIFALIGCAIFFDRLLLALETAFLGKAPDGVDSIDYVIVLGPIDDNDDDAKDKRRRRRRIPEQIRQLGLHVEEIDSSFWNEGDSELVSVYAIQVPFPLLVRYAEEVNLKKRVRRTGRLVPFDGSCGRRFVGFVDGDRRSFSRFEQQRLALHAMRSIRDGAAAAVIDLALHDGIIRQMFPISNVVEAQAVLRRWSSSPSSPTSIAALADYLGTEITFSFVWLSSYTQFLWVPATLGAIVYALSSTMADDLFSIGFAALMPILATVFLELWKRRSVRLQYELGVQDLESFEPIRPEFQDYRQRIPLTSIEIGHSLRRAMISIVSFPIMVTMLLLTAVAMFVQFETQSYIGGRLSGSALIHVPSVIFGLLLPRLHDLYDRVAQRITRWENHRTDTSFRNALLIRQILLKCISSFMSLFYLLFWVQDLDRVRQQLATLLITSQCIQQIQEVGTPIAKALVRAVLSKKTTGEVAADRQRLLNGEAISIGPKGKRIIPAVEDESIRDVFANTDDDYSEMVIQFGYVFIFGWSWPLAAACALINNITEIRSDCFKICMVMQKPRPTNANSIGVWYYALECISVIAILCNAAHLFVRVCHDPDAFSADVSLQVKIGAIIAVEHVVLGAKFLIDFMIPDIPGDIRDQIAKEQIEFAKQQSRQVKELSPSAPSSFVAAGSA